MEELKLIQENQPTFVKEKKQEAMEIFRNLPMPTEKNESWRYTDISKLDLVNLKQSYLGNGSPCKIFVDEISEELVNKGVKILNMNTALQNFPLANKYFFSGTKIDEDKLLAFNASYFDNGFFIYIPKNIEVKKPIRIVITNNGPAVLHNMIIAEENAQVDFIEEYSTNVTSQDLAEDKTPSKNKRLNACVTEVFAMSSSKINFHHLNNWGNATDNFYNFTNIIGLVERDASINWFSSCLGGKLNRLKIDTIFNGHGSQSNNIGMFLGKSTEHIDITTNVYHKAENTTNDILMYGILKEQSTSVYRGLIRIEEQARKTNSYLTNHILKIGDKTLANSVPSLKIDCNDVKASHGATVGQIDEEHLFYLMSRGLNRKEAENLIVDGFFQPIIDKIKLESLRDKLRIIKN